MSGRQSSLNASTTVGVVPRAVQTEFEKEENKIKQFESINKKFYKDIKYYIDKLDDLIKSETKMINNISDLAQISLNESSSSTSSSSTNDASSSSSQVVEATTSSSSSSSSSSSNNPATATTSSSFRVDDLNREFLVKLTSCRELLLSEHTKSAETFKAASLSSVAEPIKTLNSIFPQVYEAIERRKSVLKDLLKKQEKLDKLQNRERTGDNLVLINELKQSVEQVKLQFQKEHLFLMEELPKLYASRIDYIKPCVNTLISSQAKFYQEYSQFYESILKDSSSSSSEQQDSETTSSSAATANGNNNGDENRRDYVNMPPSAKTTTSFSSPAANDSTSADNEIEKLSNEIQQCLKEIKSLSIVASD